MTLLRDFADLSGWEKRVPDETTILRFRCVLERTQAGIANSDADPSLAAEQGPNDVSQPGGGRRANRRAEFEQNADGERDSEMKQSEESNH